MRDIQEIGIDVSTQKITGQKGALLRKHSGDYLTGYWCMLYTDKVNEVPATLTKVISYLPSKGEDTAILHTNLAHAYLLSGDYKAANTRWH